MRFFSGHIGKVWAVAGAVVAIAVGVAVTVLGYSPADYDVARFCFLVAALVVAAATLVSLTNAPWPTWARVSVTALAFATIGVLLVETLRWVDRRERPIPTLPPAISEFEAAVRMGTATDPGIVITTDPPIADASRDSAQEVLAYASGGDSYPLVFVGSVTPADGSKRLGLFLQKIGKYPLYGLRVHAGRAYRVGETNTLSVSGQPLEFAELNDAASRPMGEAQPTPTEPVAHYVAYANARNGRWEEVIEVRQVGDEIVSRTVLFHTENPIGQPDKKVLDIADVGFPSDARNLPIYPLSAAALPRAP